MTVTTSTRSNHDASWQCPLFTAAALLALALIGLNGLLLLQPDLFDGVLNQNTVSAAASHFSTLDHRIHDITFSGRAIPDIPTHWPRLGSARSDVLGQAQQRGLRRYKE